MKNKGFMVKLGWVSGLAFALGVLSSVAVSAEGLEDVESFSALQQIAEEQGAVRVIVALKTPKRPKGGAKGWLNLSNYIADVQARTKKELGWVNFNDLVEYKYVAGMAMSVSAAELKELSSVSTVEAVYEDRVLEASLAKSVPRIGLGSKGSAGGRYSGKGQTIAIIDNAVDAEHPFLQGRVVDEACFSVNARDNEGNRIVSLCPNGQAKQLGKGAAKPCGGDCSHGTHVAGIAAGKGDDFTGVAPGATLLVAQVFYRLEGPLCKQPNGCYRTYTSLYIQALEWVYEQRDRYKIAAVNMSLGGGKYKGTCGHPAQEIVYLLRKAGIATVVASGNDYNKHGIASPACLPGAIAVGATASANDWVALFSNSSPRLDLLAPGTGEFVIRDGPKGPYPHYLSKIKSSVPGGGFVEYNGTSMAAPHVAGAFAVLREAKPDASVDELLGVLKQSGVIIRDPINSLKVPRIQVDKALAMLAPKAVKAEPAKRVKKQNPPSKKVVAGRVKSAPAPKKQVKTPRKPKNEVEEYDGIRVYQGNAPATDSSGGIQW